jgi:hydrogenase nickel incorporation protein HypB
MSSPGSGKTSLLEKTIEEKSLKIVAIEGELETNRDADRIKAKGAGAYQITTGTACHLDAHMLHHALYELPINDMDVVFIENVGNLVCPASYDLGAHLNVVLLYILDGADKIQKYPVMFRAADLIVFTKCDLLPYFDFDMTQTKEDARRLKQNGSVRRAYSYHNEIRHKPDDA